MGQQDLSVHELVAKIERGDIRLPEMQRQYVWRSTRVRDLLDSLYREYPSGMILTWESDDEVTTRDFAVDQDDSQQRGFQLLLDGQQRLTSLLAILRGKHVNVRGRKRPIDILFNLNHPEDLEEVTEVFENGEGEDGVDIDLDESTADESTADESTADESTADESTADESTADESTADASEDEILERSEKMAFVVHSNRLAKVPHWVSVTEVFKEDSDVPFLKKAGITKMEDPRYKLFSDRLRKLRKIRDYSYRVHILTRDMSYEEVTEIFVRVNSLGAKLRSSDLALAQITAKWRGALEIFQKFDAQCGELGFSLGQAIHLKNLVAFATWQSRYKTIGSLRKEKLESEWKEAKKGMEFALEFLHRNVGIDSPALLSSPFILIALAMYGHSKEYDLSPEESSQLCYWTLMANVKARYSRGSSETFLDQDLAAIRRRQGIEGLLQSLKTQAGRLDVSPSDLENRNSRSAYFKTMFMAFKEDKAKDWRDELIIDLKKSGPQHRLQFHHIFPRAVLKKAGLPSRKINDICNLAFISARTNRRISDKEPVDYLPGVKDKIGSDGLGKQCIPDDPSLWKVDEYENFLDERRKLIAKRLNELLGHGQRQEGDSN